MTTRTTVVWCVDWPVASLLKADQATQPAAAFHANRVVAATAAARALGVEVGLRRREAQRRAPDLLVLQRDLSAEARAFEAVLSALDDITPRVEITEAGWCSFATRGPSRYFGGDESMGDRVHRVVSEAVGDALGHCPGVLIGTADTRFTARLAALTRGIDPPGHNRVVPPDCGAAFLAPLSVSVLDDDELADVLKRLGLRTLGDFAALSAADVLGRFGTAGARAHERARGAEARLADVRDPPPDLDVQVDLDPPVQRVDQAAFIAKVLADEFCQNLADRGMSCAQVAIIAETEHGEEQQRLWRGDGAMSAGAIADRMRWQLDGWLNGAARHRPTGGLIRLALYPDQVIGATGRQLGFWGGETQGAERAARAVARVQGIVGQGGVVVAEPGGGRNAADTVVRVPADAVDLADRAVEGVHETGRPWTGRIPPPLPTVVFDPMRQATVLDSAGEAVAVQGRGLMIGVPATLAIGRTPPRRIRSWAGPWLLDERWWDRVRTLRRARFQVVTDDGRAHLVVCERGNWFIEAVYD